MSKDKLNLIELKIGDELFSVLKEINSRTKIPLTKIVISILNEKLQDIKELNYNKEFIEDYKNINNDLETQIRFRINENEKICYQWENNCFQMIHSMIEYTLIANKGDEVHVRLFRPRLFRKVVPFFEELYGNTGYRYSNIQ